MQHQGFLTKIYRYKKINLLWPAYFQMMWAMDEFDGLLRHNSFVQISSKKLQIKSSQVKAYLELRCFFIISARNKLCQKVNIRILWNLKLTRRRNNNNDSIHEFNKWLSLINETWTDSQTDLMFSSSSSSLCRFCSAYSL